MTTRYTEAVRESVTQKASRLLAQGKVGRPLPALLVPVEGDHGAYQVTLAALAGGPSLCTCDHGRLSEDGECSHIKAARAAVKAARQ